MQVAHKNKARVEHSEQQDRGEIDEDEGFDMMDVDVPDLGLVDHAVTVEYQEAVSAMIYRYYESRLRQE
jgi:hypothetical protein